MSVLLRRMRTSARDAGGESHSAQQCWFMSRLDLIVLLSYHQQVRYIEGFFLNIMCPHKVSIALDQHSILFSLSSPVQKCGMDARDDDDNDDVGR